MPSTDIFTYVINTYLPEPHSSLLSGILFGINLKTTKLFYEQLKIVGLLHIVVLSGMNITILMVIIGQITGIFSKRLSLLITILTIIIFVLFVGPQAPVIRAAFMSILTLVAIMFERKNLALYSLILSFIFISIFFPDWITTVSLQLSYAATLGLIFFARNHKNPILNELRITLSAQVFTVPIIFLYFKQISLISPLANVLVAPIVPSLMIFGFLTVILGKINYFLGLVPSYVTYGLLTYLIWVIETLSKIPYASIQFK